MIYADDVRSGSDCPVFIENVELLNDDLTTKLATAADITIFVQITDAHNTITTTVQAQPTAQTALTPPSTWVAHVPATALVFNNSPWRFAFIFHGPAGINDALLYTETTFVNDNNH